MAHPGSVKKEPGGSGNPTGHNRLRRFGALVTTGLAIVALSACTNAEAQPEQPRPSASATQYPGEVPPPDSSGTEEGDNDTNPEDPQTQGEFEGVDSGLTVDYESFTNWDSLPGPHALDLFHSPANENPPSTLKAPIVSKRYVSDNFFISNGAPYYSDYRGQRGTMETVYGSKADADAHVRNREGLWKTNPKQFVEQLLAKEGMVMALSMDTSDPRNQKIADDLVEAVTDKDSPARDELRQRIQEVRQGLLSPEEAAIQNKKILRYSERPSATSGTTPGQYYIEYETTRYGEEVIVQQVFIRTASSDFRALKTAYKYKNQGEQVDTINWRGPMIEADQ